MSLTTRSKALAGGLAGTALVLTLGVAAVAQMGGDPTTPAAPVAHAGGAPAGTPALVPAEVPPVETPATTTTAPAPAAPATTAPATKAAPSTTPTTKKPAAPATTTAPAPVAPTPTTAPAAPKLPPGQRVPYTTAAVQAAATTLTQRIPLFKPTPAQLQTFADAVCTSLDQGQTLAQVQATVRDAVSRIQGQSLSEPDAAFAVRTVVQLRCPGYLP
jgi:hypothetical protein